MHFVVKQSHFVTKKLTHFCNKLLLHFVIKYLSHFILQCHNEPNMKKSQPLLAHKIKFPTVWYHDDFIMQCPLVRSPIDGGVFLSFFLNKNSRNAWNFCLTFGHFLTKLPVKNYGTLSVDWQNSILDWFSVGVHEYETFSSFYFLTFCFYLLNF